MLTAPDTIAIVVALIAVMAVYGPRRWRELVCDHDWQGFSPTATFLNARDEMPVRRFQVFRCNKCGASRKYEH